MSSCKGITNNKGFECEVPKHIIIISLSFTGCAVTSGLQTYENKVLLRQNKEQKFLLFN